MFPPNHHRLYVETERAFIEQWKYDYPKDRLLFLAKRYANVEILGIRYPPVIMDELSRLAHQVPRCQPQQLHPNPCFRPDYTVDEHSESNIFMKTFTTEDVTQTLSPAYNKTQTANADRDVIIINVPLETISLIDDDSSDGTPFRAIDTTPDTENYESADRTEEAMDTEGNQSPKEPVMNDQFETAASNTDSNRVPNQQPYGNVEGREMNQQMSKKARKRAKNRITRFQHDRCNQFAFSQAQNTPLPNRRARARIAAMARQQQLINPATVTDSQSPEPQTVLEDAHAQNTPLRKMPNRRARARIAAMARQQQLNNPANVTDSQSPEPQTVLEDPTKPIIDLTENDDGMQKVDTTKITQLRVSITTDPPSFMKFDHADMLKNVITEKILLAAHESRFVPAFRGRPILSHGKLKVWCGDEDTLHWLRVTLSELPAPEHGRYIAEPVEDVDIFVKSGILLPGHSVSDAVLALRMLCQQNCWENILNWKLYRANIQKRGLFLTLGIPLPDIPKLLSAEKRLSYLMGSVYVRFFRGKRLCDTLPPFITNIVGTQLREMKNFL